MKHVTLLGALLSLIACAPEQPRHEHVMQSSAELRPTDTNSALMWRYGASDSVEHFDSVGGGFKVHFTRAGINGVPTADTNDSGVPDLVEAVANVYDQVGAKYHGELGYRRPTSDATLPNNGGDGRFDVYLLNFEQGADGAFRVDTCTQPNMDVCQGYVVQENDFVGFGYPNATVATRILGSHEYFHAVQAAHDNEQGVVFSEATAVWATEQFDPSTSDLEGFIDGYLDRTDRSIDSPPPGPVPTFAYGTAVFAQFLSEKYDAALIRKVWEACENGHGLASEPADQANPKWVVQLDAVLQRDYQSSFAAAFAEFARWNLYLGAAADPTKSYRNGAAYPPVTASTVTAPHQLFPMRVFYASTQYFTLTPGGRASLTAALVDDASTMEDETAGLEVWIAARKSGRNLEVTNGTVNTSMADSVVVAVVNTARGANGAVLSKRPGLCIGTAAEVATCRAAINPTAQPVDAGVETSFELAPKGLGRNAGCSASPMVLMACALLLRRRRR